VSTERQYLPLNLSSVESIRRVDPRYQYIISTFASLEA
jgi:hypothetical protein